MKKVSFALIAFWFVCAACSKHVSVSANDGTVWQLVRQEVTIGAGDHVYTPGKDSAVALVLKNDSTYVTTLNGKIVCHGSYTLQAPGQGYTSQQLQLNNFSGTGIFTPFTLFEVGSNGQVVSESSYFIATISTNTLTLRSPITPGGGVEYLFTK